MIKAQLPNQTRFVFTIINDTDDAFLWRANLFTIFLQKRRYSLQKPSGCVLYVTVIAKEIVFQITNIDTPVKSRNRTKSVDFNGCGPLIIAKSLILGQIRAPVF